MLKASKLHELATAGVTLLDPATTYIDDSVTIGSGTIIHPGVTLEGRCRIGRNCRIRSWVRITDSTLGDEVLVNDCCVIVESTIDAGGHVGPFAYLRPGSHMKDGAHIGSFVELKKTVLGERSKANHLTYLGDATVGAGVNVGAGTITCNYDGTTKHQTIIEDGAFVGSDTMLVAPVRVGKGAFIGAGSVITKDVPADSLAVERSDQTIINNWAKKRMKRKDNS
jgi:bifunctional UDP-N-acetylglucosamine pyrophosphorylase/glucosamine-1-phosphate N-acetyltransferase